uniref:Ubiquinol oxidase n=1 Tax=Oryza rufipogon TaxID=4529 RepID=A0A679BAH6_ORYRU|nr:mitochondrial alternative oxidase 1c-like [Oryza rufipogon]
MYHDDGVPVRHCVEQVERGGRGIPLAEVEGEEGVAVEGAEREREAEGESVDGAGEEEKLVAGGVRQAGGGASGRGAAPATAAELRIWATPSFALEPRSGLGGSGRDLNEEVGLRTMSDSQTWSSGGGWIRALLEEAENERMHLMTFMEVAKPRWYERTLVLAVQRVFFNAYFLGYLFSPKLAHRVVGYLEEEAIHSYTEYLKDIEARKIDNVPAPPIAIDY